MNSILKNRETESFHNEVLEVVEERIEKGKASRLNLSWLLEKLKKLNYISPRRNKSLLEKSKIYFLSDLEGLDEFERLFDFRDLFPELISDNELLDVKNKFEVVATDDSKYTDDPEGYREDACNIQNISEKLGIDMSERIEELEYIADELEAKCNEPDYDHEFSSSSSEQHCSDDDIDSLFSTFDNS